MKGSSSDLHASIDNSSSISENQFAKKSNPTLVNFDEADSKSLENKRDIGNSAGYKLQKKYLKPDDVDNKNGSNEQSMKNIDQESFHSQSEIESSNSQWEAFGMGSKKSGKKDKEFKYVRPSKFKDVEGMDNLEMEFENFFPIYKQMYKLKEIEDSGGRVRGQDYFVSYLHSMKESEELRKKRKKEENKHFMDVIGTIIEQQNRQTKILMERLENVQRERDENIQSRF